MTGNLREAARRLTLAEGRRKLGVSERTMARYVQTGCCGVILETFAIGWRRYVTEEMLDRFISATTANRPKRGQSVARAATPNGNAEANVAIA